MRELPDRDHILLKRDAAPILYVPAHTWNCMLCDPDGSRSVATSTVVWLGSNSEGPHGRCSTCGQKYELGRAFESVPTIAEQMHTTEELLGGDP